MSEAVKTVRDLKPLRVADANTVKAAAQQPVLASPAAVGEKPGVERWAVKTGTDLDVGQVGTNIVNGTDLGFGLVDTTVEEMRALKRPPDMLPVTASFAKNSPYENHRSAPVETTVWRLTAVITKARLEQDGDYHLVLQGVSGVTMIAEIPNPDPAFVGNATWRADIARGRAAMDQKLGHPLKAIGFALTDMAPPKSDRFATPQAKPPAEAPMTPVNARAVITGVGFFDSDHGQTGVAPTAIEIHPVLDLAFL